MSKHTVFLLIFLWASQALIAQSPQITGAFGFKFGTKFDTSRAVKKVELGGGPAYVVEPISPYRACNVYRVVITPKTHLIHTIHGVGWFTDANGAVKEALLILELLEQKYGLNENVVNWRTFDEFNHLFKKGPRRVYVFIEEGESGYEFSIIYTDENLSKKANKEQREIDLSEIDPSGL